MNVIVLMAGDGKRFKDIGYNIPKPYIKINDKLIFEWTLSSLPFLESKNLHFAIRTDHLQYFPADSYILDHFKDSKIFQFAKLTRGNMETAYLTSLHFDFNPEEPLLILDADNLYNGSNFLNDLLKINEKDFGTVCYFERLNDDIKWGFGIFDKDNNLLEIIEKDKRAIELNGNPLMGNFYFSKAKLFLDTSKKILENDSPNKGEYYMTQIFGSLIKENIPIKGIKVTDVKPLGTPEDILNYIKE